MSTQTPERAAHYPDHVTDHPQQHVRDALSTLKELEDEVVKAKKALDDAYSQRLAALRAHYPMLKAAKIGPSAIERATGIGKSNVRAMTRDL